MCGIEQPLSVSSTEKISAYIYIYIYIYIHTSDSACNLQVLTKQLVVGSVVSG